MACVCAALCLAFLPPAARADLITSLTPEITPQAGGRLHYTYMLSNSGSSDIGVVALNLAIPEDADLQSLFGPAGWDILYAPGDTVVSWESPAPSLDIIPGTFGVFGFTSPLAPGADEFSILGFDDSTFRLESNTGFVAAPSDAVPVPEPGSLVLLSAGIVCLLGHQWRRSQDTAAGS
jgi:hypothetical protein